MSRLTIGEHFAVTKNNLNLMRLLAAFSVIYGHASAITGNGPPDIFLQLVGFKFIGGVAVDVFFVISGFLITASALSGKGLIYYCASRILRIYPALIVCILLTVFVLGPLLSTSPVYWTSPQTWSYLLGNTTAWKTEYFLPGVFDSLHDKAVNGTLWSIAIEVRLYIIVLVLAMLLLIKNKTIFNLLFFISIIGGFLVPGMWKNIFAYENHLHVAMMFLIGSFVWINRAQIPLNPAILLALLFFAASQKGLPSFGIAYSILIPYVVFYVAFAPGGAWFNKFGDYSYGVYLYGWISQQIVQQYMPQASNGLNSWLACGLALIFGIASWHLIEQPSLRLRHKFRSI